MDAVRDLSDTVHALPVRLQVELLRHLRCTDEARAEERERLRPDPRLADWLDLLDELESGGPLMRDAVRDALELTCPTRLAGAERLDLVDVVGA